MARQEQPRREDRADDEQPYQQDLSLPSPHSRSVPVNVQVHEQHQDAHKSARAEHGQQRHVSREEPGLLHLFNSLGRSQVPLSQYRLALLHRLNHRLDVIYRLLPLLGSLVLVQGHVDGDQGRNEGDGGRFLVGAERGCQPVGEAGASVRHVGRAHQSAVAHHGVVGDQHVAVAPELVFAVGQSEQGIERLLGEGNTLQHGLPSRLKRVRPRSRRPARRLWRIG